MNDHSAPRVNQLRRLLDAEEPAIAVSFTDGGTDDDVSAAKDEGLDIAELRIDRYSDWSTEYVLRQVDRFEGLPTIATVRASNEGGEWSGSDSARAELYRAVLPFVDGIDIELASLDASVELRAVVTEAHRLDKVVIISNHNFDHTPTRSELDGLASRAKDHGADIVKLAAMTHAPADTRVLARFTMDNAALGLIVIAMGAHGSSSRVFFPSLGSRLTYAHGGNWVVPGQLGFRETFEMLRQFYPEFNQKKILELQLLDGH